MATQTYRLPIPLSPQTRESWNHIVNNCLLLARYTCNALKNLPPETCQVTPHSLLPQYMQTERSLTITLNVNTPALFPKTPCNHQ